MGTSIGTFQISSGLSLSDTLQVTGLAARPDAVILRWTGRDSQVDAGPSRQNISAGMGFLVGNSKRGCIAEWAQNGADPYTAGSSIWNDQAVVRMNGGGSTGGKADFSDMLDDGFELVIDEVFGATITVAYMAIWGKQFDLLEITEPASTGDQLTATAFDPTFAMLLATDNAAFGSSSAESVLSIGAASGTGADRHGVWAKFEDSSLGFADVGTYCRRTECLAIMTSDVAMNARAKVSSFTGGLTLNWLERGGSRKVLALISDGRWFVGNDTTRTNTTPFTLSGFTWSPEAFFMASAGAAESTQDTGDQSASSGAGNLSIGFGVGPADRLCFHTRYTADTLMGASRSVTWHEFDQVYLNATGASTPAQDGAGDIDAAFATDDIEIVMDDADPSAAFFFYVAVGGPVTEFREQLIGLSHNSYESLNAGRPIFRDVFGRILPPEQVEQDQWIFSGAALWPSPVKYEDLLEDPNVFYAESVSLNGEVLNIETDRESFFEALMRRLGRSA